MTISSIIYNLFRTTQDNLVAGVERIAYRIHGESCGGSNIFIPANITNEYSNNEAHAAMSGVNLFPSDPGFTYDRSKHQYTEIV